MLELLKRLVLNRPLTHAEGDENWTAIEDAINSITVESGTTAIENEYEDIAAMLADQGNQTESALQWVKEAQADPNINEGYAYYEKLVSSTATLAADYRLLSQQEAEVIEGGIQKVMDQNGNAFATALKVVYGEGFMISLVPGGGYRLERKKPTVSANTGTEINTANDQGDWKADVANAATSYSLGPVIIPGFFEVRLINAPSKPSVTGATEITGSDFEADTDMYMVTWNNGTRNEFHFQAI